MTEKRRAAAEYGSGDWGSWVDCRELRVFWFETEEQARRANDNATVLGCGGFCRDNHWVAPR